MKWCYPFLVIRLTLDEEVITRANIVFVTHTSIVISDLIKLIEIAVRFPKPLDTDWGSCKNFLKTLKVIEIHVWRETQWGYCNNHRLNGILANSQNTLITTLRKDISEIEEERTQLIRDVKILKNQRSS